MSVAQCLQHGEVERAWPCARCGTFLCEACAHRARPTAVAMCSDCWALRGAHVEALQPRGNHQGLGIVLLGVLALVPMLIPVQLATIIASLVLLRRRQLPPAGPRLALGFASLGFMLTLVFIFWGVLDPVDGTP